MLVKILKITIALLSIGFLTKIVLTRNILSEPQVIPQTKDIAPTLNIDTQNTETQQPEVTEVEPVTTGNIGPQEKIATYETLKEVTLDNDPTYKPIISACTMSVGYTIGRFDTGFGISKNDFIKAIDRSAELWEKASGKSLFYYNSNGPLTINLIYDERQARTNDAGYLTLEIQNSKDTADTLRTTYLQQKEFYTAQNEELIKESEAFKVKQDTYEEKVKKYNSEGGAPQAEYDSMTRELASLKEELSLLQAKEKNLLTLTESINSQVSHYNELVAYINTLIRKSNSLGAKKFTEGRFTPKTNTIDIYQYNDSTKLHRVLAHELGHALGINHNSNVYSIMYEVNTATTTDLSEEDIESLEKICSSN